MKKFNLPATLTYRKAYTLFFLTMLNMKASNAGQAFRNCLSAHNDTTIYNNLLKFPFNKNVLINSDIQIELCCDKTSCSECSTFNSYFYCRKLFDNIFCHQHSSKCIGIVGNSSITENKSSYGASCPIKPEYRNRTDLANNLINAGPINGTDSGYASYICASDYCTGKLHSYCGWDNDGWICYSHIDAGQSYCYMQWPAPWPGHADTNPINTTPKITITTTEATRTTEATVTPTINAPTYTVKPEAEDNNLAEKIAIPIGAVAGVSITSFLTYYFCKKKQSRERQITVDNSNNQLGSTDFNNQAILNNLGHSPNTMSLVNSPAISPEINSKRSASLLLESPLSQKSVLTIKEQLIRQLEIQLIGKEQLWRDYLDANNLLANNPQSQLAIRGFYQVQNELLKTFTIGDLNLLLENENNKWSQAFQGERSETISSPQRSSLETRDPQAIISNYQEISPNYHY